MRESNVDPNQHTLPDAREAAANPAQHLVDACARATASVGTSLTLRSASVAPLTVATTAGVASQLEQLSFILGEGPQSDCARLGRNVFRPFLDDGAAEWPAFTPEALSTGVKSIFAFPLRLGAISLGVLAVYRDRAGSLSDEHLSAASGYVAGATALLLGAPADSDGDALPSVLEDPFTLQAEVHQATGMVAVQLGLDLGAALALLRAHAFSSSRAVSSVARDVVARRITLQ